jgi:hypothetical protein
LTRRQRLIEEKAKRDAERVLFCPRGWTACRVDEKSTDSYEVSDELFIPASKEKLADHKCIDTSSELDSCGGCRLGEYGVANANTTIGDE